jgi:tRNA threonylcarbamoyladenosine biosynthesis protein TsaB
MIVLALDTSTVNGSVALLEDDQPIAESLFRREQPAETLFRSIQALLASRNTAMKSVDLVVAGIGPGSFTGIRAGIAAAYGLAMPRSVPVKGVNSFDALALTVAPQIPPDCPQLCVIGDARREEIYYAIYDRAGTGVQACRIAAIEEIADEIHAPLWFVSPQIGRFADDLRACLGGFANVCPEPVFPGAAAVGRLGLKQYRADDRRGDEDLEPIYLREVQYRKSAQPATEHPTSK